MVKEENNKNKNDLPTKEDILGLIQWIDSNKPRLFRPLDGFSTWVGTLILLIAVSFSIEVILGIENSSDFNRILVLISILALTFAFFSIVIQTGKENEIEKRYERAITSRKFKDKEKPIIKALIKIRSTNEEFNLEQIYNMHSKMFTKEKLLEKLYE